MDVGGKLFLRGLCHLLAKLTHQLDRRRIAEMIERRERYARGLRNLLGPCDLLCIPTAPAPAPPKGVPQPRSSGGTGYYPRALSLTSIAGIGRLPQVSMPLADVGGKPVGLSLLAGQGQDAFLLDVVASVNEG